MSESVVVLRVVGFVFVFLGSFFVVFDPEGDRTVVDFVFVFLGSFIGFLVVPDCSELVEGVGFITCGRQFLDPEGPLLEGLLPDEEPLDEEVSAEEPRQFTGLDPGVILLLSAHIIAWRKRRRVATTNLDTIMMLNGREVK